MAHSSILTSKEKSMIIFNRHLPKRVTIGDKAFRKVTLDEIRQETGASVSSAASMYNTAKRAAVVAGLTPEFGRRAKQLAEEIPAGCRWRLTHKSSGDPLPEGYSITEAECIAKHKSLRQPEVYRVERIPFELIDLMD